MSTFLFLSLITIHSEIFLMRKLLEHNKNYFLPDFLTDVFDEVFSFPFILEDCSEIQQKSRSQSIIECLGTKNLCTTSSITPLSSMYNHMHITVMPRYNTLVGRQVYLTAVQLRHLISFLKVCLQILHTGRFLRHRYSNWQYAEYPTKNPDQNVTNRKRITIQNSKLETNNEHQKNDNFVVVCSHCVMRYL